MFSRLDPFFRRLFILTFLVLFLYALYLMKSVIAPFFAAFILAYFLNPLVSMVAKFMPRILAIAVVYISGLFVLGGLLIWLMPMLWAQLQLAWESLPALVTWYNDVVRAWIGQHTNSELMPLELNVISDALVKFFQNNYQVADAQSFIRQALTSGVSAANSLGLTVMVPILTFYFLLGWHKRLASWQAAIPKPYTKKVLEIAKDCDRALMNFAKGQLLVMLLLGAIYAVQLHLIGLNLGLIIGISAGIASFVPYLGFGFGIVAALAAGLFQFGFDWVYLALIVGAFMVGQVLEGYVLQPLLLGDKIGLSPLWVIFSVLAGASLLGFVGMLIALPVSAVLNVLVHHAYKAYLDSDWHKGARQLDMWKD
ncbi:AI-2E family transporter [Moraxella caviae]|uniref:AI-2E family transporter n=1 Tax=Moraxella caviae TaxID=34060 RepID=A0A1S9ZWE6_9GAMM|nr:AI-2E family transporter [Moraxella caviae]OOR87750.1 AI-2E family transporter [Moraxella caviae]STZ10162.1 pheromone autoinducer 2 transporter [Moraxella caviae]VEW13042.1 pheromone autoinducer 2 transporter [Moraxella caviae]